MHFVIECSDTRVAQDALAYRWVAYAIGLHTGANPFVMCTDNVPRGSRRAFNFVADRLGARRDGRTRFVDAGVWLALMFSAGMSLILPPEPEKAKGPPANSDEPRAHDSEDTPRTVEGNGVTRGE